MKFHYKAKKGPTEIIEGHMEAASETAVAKQLTEMGLFPIHISAPAGTITAKQKFSFRKRASSKDLSIFYRQFSDLLDAGMTIVDSLETLSNQAESQLIKNALQQIIPDVTGGSHLSDSMEKHSHVFPRLHINMIKSGEIGGILDEVLIRLAEFTEQETDLKNKIITAMTYPAILIIVGIATVFILLTFIVPKLIPVFEDFGQVLPLPTQLLIGISDFFVDFWWIILLAVGAFIFFINHERKTQKGRLMIDNFILKIPVFGDLLKKSEISRIGMIFGTLLKNGVPIIDSLTALTETIGNRLIKNDIIAIKEAVSTGSSLKDSMQKSDTFPLFVINMIAVGEKSGNMEKSLLKIANYYSKEVDRKVKTMTTLLEPIMILILGLIVGFIVISMLLPIFNMNLGVQ